MIANMRLSVAPSSCEVLSPARPADPSPPTTPFPPSSSIKLYVTATQRIDTIGMATRFIINMLST